MAVTRPLKEGSVTTYQQKVALGFPDILASEMDADLDTIYAAWNGNVGTANLVDGSVTYAKLAPDAQLWRDTGTALTPGTNFATRILTVPGDGTNGGSLVVGLNTGKGRVWQHPTVPITYLSHNYKLSAGAVASDDNTKPAWALLLQGNADQLQVFRAPAGSSSVTNLLTLDNAGTLTTSAYIFNTAEAVKGILTNYGVAGVRLGTNDRQAPPQPTSPSWDMVLDAGGSAAFIHRAANAASATQDHALTFDVSGNLVITGTIGQKASGTTWSNPSDRRLKDDIEDYATGLAAVLQLQPRTFLYNGKGGSTAGMRGYGFIADEIAPVMPETVGVRAGKLDAADEDETDIQTLDQSNLILALVNAVKELATRMTAVEAR
jgi:hypothetical protein